MQRKLARATRALLVAGVLGHGAASADEPIFTLPWDNAKPNEPIQIVVVEAAWAREWAVQIELNLLGDPITFPYPLKPVATAKGMELQGFVPNAMVRDRALTLARKNSKMPVVDAMTIQPNMAIILPGAPPANFQEAVQVRLARVNPEASPGIEAKLGKQGQVILTGCIHNHEDKLEYSRILRGLPGCRCVQNELIVLNSVPTSPGAKPTQDEPVKSLPPLPALPSTPTNTLPPALPAAPVPPGASLPPAAAVPQSKSPIVQVSAVQAKPDLPKSPYFTGTQIPVSGGPKPVLKFTMGTSPQASNMPRPPVTPARGTLAREVGNGNVPSVVNTKSPPDLRSSVPPAPVAPAPRTAFADDTKSGAIELLPAKATPDDLYGKAENLPRPGTYAAPKQPAEIKPPAPQAGPKPPAVPSSKSQTALKSRIKSALGKACKDVELKFDGTGGVAISLKVVQGVDMKRATIQITQMPELAAYQPSFNFLYEGIELQK